MRGGARGGCCVCSTCTTPHGGLGAARGCGSSGNGRRPAAAATGANGGGSTPLYAIADTVKPRPGSLPAAAQGGSGVGRGAFAGLYERVLTADAHPPVQASSYCGLAPRQPARVHQGVVPQEGLIPCRIGQGLQRPDATRHSKPYSLIEPTNDLHGSPTSVGRVLCCQGLISGG